MFNTWFLIIFLFMCSIFGFSDGFSKYSEYKALEKKGVVVDAYLDSPTNKFERIDIIDGEDIFQVHIKFHTYEKKEIFIYVDLPKILLNELLRNGYIKIAYNLKQPYSVMVKGTKANKGYDKLLFGFLSGCFFIITLKARYRISAFMSNISFGG